MDTSMAVYALRDLLDSDIQLRALMGTKEGDTKVFVRNTLPEAAQFPLMLVSDFVYTPLLTGQGDRGLYDAAIDVSIFASVKADGSDDLSYLCRMSALVESIVKASYAGDAGDCHFVSFRLQQSAATQTIEKYSMKIMTYVGKLSEVA